ncbi:hypothetical protein GCM10027612_57460 [Microbispora bryophytorum subsp. camponoti]
MHIPSRFLRAVSALLLGLTVLVTVSPARAAEPLTATAAVRVLRYDASRAAEFRTLMDQAAQVWNARVGNVRLVAGTPADFVVLADDGWPRTSVTRLGRGTIWMGRRRSPTATTPCASPPTRSGTSSACPIGAPAVAPT